MTAISSLLLCAWHIPVDFLSEEHVKNSVKRQMVVLLLLLFLLLLLLLLHFNCVITAI
jgi:hypothetical protein